jgi:hypothetical protein
VKVSYHVFKDFQIAGAGAATDEEILARGGPDAAKVRRLRYSFVSMCPWPEGGKLFLGCTNYRGDVLAEFDLAKRRFRSCGFPESGLLETHDAKIHKGLTLDQAGRALYFGTATLSPLHDIIETRGGGLFRYDLARRRFTELARPTKGDFYQATRFDFARRRAYIYTDRSNFVVYDLGRRKVLRYETMGSTPHNGCIDDSGGVWGTQSPFRHAFFRYDPDGDKFFFPCTAFPNAREAAGIMYAGAGPVDSFVNGGDGFLYAGSALGELYRIDPASGEVRFLGKPFPDKRLPGLAVGPDGWLYLAGGLARASMLARYHPGEERFEQLGNIEHPDGTYCHYAHEIAVVDGAVYVGETDNPRRSGYLWVCEP